MISRVLISGGGSGGHIQPALAIADEIVRRYPKIQIRFVGAKGRMEMEKVPNAGYEIDGLWISGLQRSLINLKNISFPFKLIHSLIKAGTLLNRYNPEVVIGVGGYASGPLLYRASRKRIPTLIQEQNSFPGITNKILANRFIKSLILFIFITLGIIFFQIILSKIFNHSGTLKYAFMFENNQLFFDKCLMIKNF